MQRGRSAQLGVEENRHALVTLKLLAPLLKQYGVQGYIKTTGVQHHKFTAFIVADAVSNSRFRRAIQNRAGYHLPPLFK